MLGTTTYAFTTIVAMDLLGIASGSVSDGWLRRRVRPRPYWSYCNWSSRLPV